MQLTFTIKDFEGPLDLLLHLVKASKMDLYNIDIALITKEYLNFINNNDGLSIDASSEYLVMASELVHLKVNYYSIKMKKPKKMNMNLIIRMS